MAGEGPVSAQEFRASRGGSALIMTGAVLICGWSLIVLNAVADALWQAIAICLFLGGAIVAMAVGRRLVLRPVMVRIDSDGLFLKNYNQVIPWKALESVRFTRTDKTGDGGVVELTPRRPLHPELASGMLKIGRKTNAMAGLPDYCVSMTGIEGTAAMLLAAMSFYVSVAPPNDARTGHQGGFDQ